MSCNDRLIKALEFYEDCPDGQYDDIACIAIWHFIGCSVKPHAEIHELEMQVKSLEQLKNDAINRNKTLLESLKSMQDERDHYKDRLGKNDTYLKNLNHTRLKNTQNLQNERDRYREALQAIATADWNDCGCYITALSALEGK